MARILAVDDEEQILDLIRNALEFKGHRVTCVASSPAVQNMDLGHFDLIILDVMMPELDGFSLCKSIRDIADQPIIFLTAKELETDIVNGLGAGADDYLTKPFGVDELRARVDAHLRREHREKRSFLNLGEISFDLSGKTVIANGRDVGLTMSEYKIAEYLAQNRGQVFSKSRIFETLFGDETWGDGSTIVEHIKNLRHKFTQCGAAPIQTVWGIGYKWQS